jgi:hypothetical protein
MAAESTDPSSDASRQQETGAVGLPVPVVSLSAPVAAPPLIAATRRVIPLSAKVALVTAVTVDFVQICVFPVFGPGFASVADDVLDFLAFVVFWRLIGWHWAFLPAFISELVPFLDLAPTWTLAVWIATRARDPQNLVRSPAPRPD